jgi:uncharacterized membrane protein YuzA (DUF378 family)
LLSASKDTDGFQTGQNVIVGGLAVQLVGFSVFIIVSSLFHWRIVQRPTTASVTSKVPWRQYMYVLYTVSALILIRSVFRVIEYGQGWDGSLQNAEYWLYIFDAALMFVVMALLNIWHPSSIISTSNGKPLYSETEEGFQMVRD